MGMAEPGQLVSAVLQSRLSSAAQNVVRLIDTRGSPTSPKALAEEGDEDGRVDHEARNHDFVVGPRAGAIVL